MKTLMKVLIVVIGCASCQTKEQEEIASLLGTIFERDIVRGDSVYLIQDAVLDWEGYLEGSQCNLEWLEDFMRSNSFNKKYKQYILKKMSSLFAMKLVNPISFCLLSYIRRLVLCQRIGLTK